MKYAEAFRSLGYALQSNRQDWSAEKDDGVCISIRKKQISPKSYPPYVDLWELHPDGGADEEKPGYHKKIGHLARAVNEFDGVIDVILVDGDLGESYKDAHPWDCEKRKAKWVITKFDPKSGYFRAEVVPYQERA